LATGRVAVERIASEAGISREAVAGTEMPLEEVREDIADRTLAAAATVAPPAWDLEAVAEASVGVAAVAAGAGRRHYIAERKSQELENESPSASEISQTSLDPWRGRLGVSVCVNCVRRAARRDEETSNAGAATAAGARRFDNPQQAADVLIDAAAKFDVVELAYIFGPDGDDIVFSGEFAQDRQHAANFVAEAHEKKNVSVDPKSGNRAFLLVGNDNWPFPVPLVRKGDKWSFDAKAGRRNSSTAGSVRMNWTPFKFAMDTWRPSMNTLFNPMRVTT